jgi:hypothetical protein
MHHMAQATAKKCAAIIVAAQPATHLPDIFPYFGTSA